MSESISRMYGESVGPVIVGLSIGPQFIGESLLSHACLCVIALPLGSGCRL